MIKLPVFFKFLKNFIILGKRSWLKYVLADNNEKTPSYFSVSQLDIYSAMSPILRVAFFSKKMVNFGPANLPWCYEIEHDNK